MIHRAGLGIGCALAAAAIYGLMPNFTRAAYEGGVPAVESIFFRTSLVAVAFAIVAVARGESLAVPRGARLPFYAQALATGGVSIGYMTSVQFIPVGLAGIIFYTYPVIILLMASLVERRAPGPIKTGIAVFAFLGLILAIGPSFGSLDWRGLALAAVASLSAVMQFFSGRWISHYMTPIGFGCRVHLAIWPMTLLLALYFGGGHIQSFPGGTATGMGYFFLAGVAIFYVLSYFTQMMSLRFAPASTVAPFFNLEPVITILVAALLLGEVLDWNQYAGGFMVLLTLAASSFIDMRRPAERRRNKPAERRPGKKRRQAARAAA